MQRRIIKRDISDEIIKYLDTDNVIVLHGSRQVGKTHILYFLQDYLKSKNKLTYFFDLEDYRLTDILDSGVDSLLSYIKGEGIDLENVKRVGSKVYLFIDEIQYLKNPSPLLKLIADHHKYIQLIVSGSSSFGIKSKFSDSLVGRTVNFEIHNLSFREFLRFKEIEINLANIKNNFHIKKITELYMEYIFYGDYPKVVLEDSLEKKEKYLLQIIDTYIRRDINDLAKVKDVQKFNNLLRVLASQSGQLLNIADLSSVCPLAKQTIENYLFILENTYIIKLIKPFSSSARVEVIKTPKIFFYDTGLLQMLWLKGTQKNIIGNIFETSIFSELVKKYGAENINYWRNRNQNEIDFILNIKDTILPIEVKLNFRRFKKLSMSFFCEKYGIKDYRIVGLIGEKQGPEYIYPWEI